MKITKVVKKDSKNVSIYLDNNNVIFINYEVFVKSGLRKDDDISEIQIESLIKDNQRFAVKQRAFRYLGRRLLSENELRLKLKLKKYDENIIDEIIEDLKVKDYLNDMEFANVFSSENIRNKFWGKNKVKAELMRRGVDNEIISQVLLEKFPEGNNLNNAIELAQKKYLLLSRRILEQKKIKEKIISFLFSKGYDYEVSREAFEKIIKSEEDST
ncbi:MAG: RecX family transcriptional regulator [Ignavibacteriaceae bacterium]